MEKEDTKDADQEKSGDCDKGKKKREEINKKRELFDFLDRR